MLLGPTTSSQFRQRHNFWPYDMERTGSRHQLRVTYCRCIEVRIKTLCYWKS